MNATIKKMTRIMDELTYFFFSVGSQGIQINLLRLENGCELHFSSGYSPSELRPFPPGERRIFHTSFLLRLQFSPPRKAGPAPPPGAG